ncbi:MAG: hypothetical protein GYB68_15510, partial [Chloroflexi bacterium]|nr:hypothetical protein [Chloroflexota bacterium]
MSDPNEQDLTPQEKDRRASLRAEGKLPDEDLPENERPRSAAGGSGRQGMRGLP